MIAWFARNDVAANLLLICVIIGGVYSLTMSLKMEVFPEVEPDIISVSVPLRGATPEDIELGVAIRIEEAVQDLEGIDKITSRSIEGSTSVSIEVDSDYDPRELLNDIKNRVDSINTFPSGYYHGGCRELQRVRNSQFYRTNSR
jgi:multidrug efflux pump subunit AcrB